MKKKPNSKAVVSKDEERLELFAIVALHGYLVMCTRMDYEPGTEQRAAEYAIKYAKALMAEVKKTKGAS